MPRRSSASVRPWLVAALFACSALLWPCGAQSTMDQHALGADATASSAISYVGTPGTESFVPAHMRHASHALPRTSSSATPLSSASIGSPEFSGETLSRENTDALGVVPRADTPSRAPPTA